MVYRLTCSRYAVLNISLVRLTVLAALAAVAPPAQMDFTGFWVLRIPRGDGTFADTFIHLKQSGDTITGEMVQGQRRVPLQEGSLKDGQAALRHPRGRGGRGPKT